MLTLCPKAEPFSLETRIKERLNTEYYFGLNSSVSPDLRFPEETEPQPLDFSKRRDRDEMESPPLRRDRTRKSPSSESGVSSGSDSPSGGSSGTFKGSSSRKHRPSPKWNRGGGVNGLRVPDFVSSSLGNLDIKSHQFGFPAQSPLRSPNPPSVPPPLPSRFYSPDGANGVDLQAAAAAMFNPVGSPLASSLLLSQFPIRQMNQFPQMPQTPIATAYNQQIMQLMRNYNATADKYNAKEVGQISCVKHLQEKLHLNPSEFPTIPGCYDYLSLNSVDEMREASDRKYSCFRETVHLKKSGAEPAAKSRRASSSRRVEAAPFPYPRHSEEATSPSPSEGEMNPARLQYMEKRKKNNEAAKKSRDQRKFKEEETTIRGAFLELENRELFVANLDLRKLIEQLEAHLQMFMQQSK